MAAVHVVLPAGIDDPHRPSGGNVYDRRLLAGLAGHGWSLREHLVSGREALAAVLGALPDGSVVVVDGLVGSTEPEVLVPASQRLCVVVLLHMPRDGQEERAVLAAAAAVVTTSRWTRGVVLERYALDPGRVRVAEPGVDPGGLAPGTEHGGELLCIGPVTRAKGHDVLVDALASVADLSWRCTCVGARGLDPEFAGWLDGRARARGIAEGLLFTGPLSRADLDAAYAAADVLVTPSRAETWGMAVSEALAHGVPVLATLAGGLPEALGRGPGDVRPGVLVPVDDPTALGGALRRWLSDPDLRHSLRSAARLRRRTLPGWDRTTEAFSRVLHDLGAAA